MLWGMKRYILRLGLVALLAVAVVGCAAARFSPPRGTKKIVRTMEITAYCPCKKCCNWKRNWLFRPVIASGPNKGKRKKVGVTACGRKAKPGTIAADTRYYPFGTVMYIPGYGYGRVEDRGGAIKGPNRLDVFFKKHKQALRWGRQKKRVAIWVAR